MERIDVLYSGDGFVVINKPVGADSEDKGEGGAPALIREELSVSEVYPIHRLDKIASGAFLCATRADTAAVLSKKMTEGGLEKEYLVICEGLFEEESGVMEDLLFYDRQKRKSFAVSRARSGVKRARLFYECLGSSMAEEGRPVSFVRVKLETGRTHQIRAQFASRRHPLLGDGKYGSKYNRTTAALMCHALTIDGERIECPVPKTFPWSLFSDTEL